MGQFWSLPQAFKNHYAPQYLNNVDSMMLMVAHDSKRRQMVMPKSFFTDLTAAAKVQEHTYIEMLWSHTKLYNTLSKWDGACRLCKYKGINTKYLHQHLQDWHYRAYVNSKRDLREKQLADIAKVKAEWAVELREFKQQWKIAQQFKGLQKQIATQQEQITALTLLVQKLVDQ